MKINLNTLTLISLLLLLSSLIFRIIQANKKEVYKCKVLETYYDQAGHVNDANCVVVVHIIKLNKTTSINLSPENFYFATKYKENGKIIGYYFNKLEILRLMNKTDYSAILISISMILFGLFIVLQFMSHIAKL